MREPGSVRQADQLVNAEHPDAAHPVGYHLDVAADVDSAAAELVLEVPVDPLGGRVFLQPVGGPSHRVSVSSACSHVRRRDEVDDGDMAELLLAGPDSGRVAGVVYQVVQAGGPAWLVGAPTAVPPVVQRRRGQDAAHGVSVR